MLCDACKEKEATVHLTQMVNDDVKKVHLCEDCATASGLSANNPAFLTDVLLGLGGQRAQEEAGPDKTCSVCQMHLSDYRKTSRLGCQNCYTAFESELASIIESVQKGGAHVGKCPSRLPGKAQEKESLAELEKALETAVAEEHYEEAARIRDRLSCRSDGKLKKNESVG